MDIQDKIWESVKNGDLLKIKYYIRKGADVNAYYRHNYSLLIVASSVNNLDIVRLLLNCGADINRCTLYGGSALSVAAYDTKIRVFKYLLEKGASIQTDVDPLGQTILMQASRDNQQQIVKILLPRKIGINSQNQEGNTAMLLAGKYQHWECVKLLIKSGANTKLKNKKGEDIFSVAKIKNYKLSINIK
jgi:ankyrin repeat protein